MKQWNKGCGQHLAIVVVLLMTAAVAARAQSIQPIITEYHGAGDGKFAVTNNSLVPMVVVLEPRSFDIDEQGKGLYRELDKEIHVELSSMSFVLQPQETHYVFYRASAERLPAWFTVYASFGAAAHSDGLDVRLMLPHTVYLYGKQPVEQAQVQLSGVRYDAAEKTITGMLINSSNQLVRVQSVRATGAHGAGEASGFPLLPGRPRQVQVAWSGGTPPANLELRFPGFTLKRALGGSE